MSPDRLRMLVLAAAAVLLTGCPSANGPREAASEPDIRSTLALMERARRARAQEWLRLHNVLASAAVMHPQPMLRARVALALAVGERAPEELARAAQLMDTLLDGANTPGHQLPEAMRNLLLVQRGQLQTRRENAARIEELEKQVALRGAVLSRESASHTRTRAERDEARAALSRAREKLRQVTRIELKHEASGS